MFFLMPELLQPIKTITINFTMFESFLDIDFVDGAYWTLHIEMLFYGLIALVLFIKLTKHTKFICLITFIIDIF